MEKIKIINKKNNVIKEIEKKLVGDYLGTKEWELKKDTEFSKKSNQKSSVE